MFDFFVGVLVFLYVIIFFLGMVIVVGRFYYKMFRKIFCVLMVFFDIILVGWIINCFFVDIDIMDNILFLIFWIMLNFLFFVLSIFIVCIINMFYFVVVIVFMVIFYYFIMVNI